MKKNIGFVSLDSCLTEWLLEKLRLSAPDTPAAKELQEGLSELMNGTASSLMVEMGEISPKTFLGDVIHCGALSIDLRLRRVIRDGKEIPVTDKRYRWYVHIWCDLFYIRAGILFVKARAARLRRKMGKSR